MLRSILSISFHNCDVVAQVLRFKGPNAVCKVSFKLLFTYRVSSDSQAREK